uniref:Uncharacterized protein n=1 Tax=viral metagenome TaxID=1070528 RepID=A0A6H1ZXQ0_9ZZZZ
MPEEVIQDQTKEMDQTAEGTAAAEGLAREDGWVSKDEWKGDPADWKTAQDFLNYDGASRKQLHERNDRLFKEIAEVKRSLKAADMRSAEYERNMRALVAMQAQAIAQTRESARQEIIAKQRTAAQEGDTEAFEKLEKERDKLEKEAPRAASPAQQINIPLDVQEWIRENSWFTNNRTLSVAAQSEYTDMLAARGYETDANLSPEERISILNEVKTSIQRRYADKFGIKPQQVEADPAGKGPEVFGGAGTVRSKPTGGNSKSFVDLPKEAKDMYGEFVKAGVYKDDKAGKDKYAKGFFEHQSRDMEE